MCSDRVHSAWITCDERIVVSVACVLRDLQTCKIYVWWNVEFCVIFFQSPYVVSRVYIHSQEFPYIFFNSLHIHPTVSIYIQRSPYTSNSLQSSYTSNGLHIHSTVSVYILQQFFPSILWESVLHSQPSLTLVSMPLLGVLPPNFVCSIFPLSLCRAVLFPRYFCVSRWWVAHTSSCNS